MRYWASGHSDSSVEVDFLLSRGKEFHAIEVKASDRLRPEHFKGLKAIEALAGLKQRILLYTGDRAFKSEEGIQVVPVECFLRSAGKWL